MNEVLKTIKERRAIRSYKDQPVPKEIIEVLIDAANNAPSAMNSQPWRFVVVTNKEFHNKLVETAVPNSLQIIEMVKETNAARYEIIKKRYKELKDPVYYSAPVIIFVIGIGMYADMSTPLACQNIMLAAKSLGLGSCWVQFGSLVLDNEEIKNKLQIKNEEKIFGPIIVGYPKEIPQSPVKKPAEIIWI